MATLHRATLTPGKLELVSAWLPSQPWAAGIDLTAAPLEKITGYRFDDPAGEVGVEVLIVRTGDRVFQVPMTYRGTALDGAGDHLIGTMDHSVLGPRFVYDGPFDPIFVGELGRTIAEADASVRQFRVDEDRKPVAEVTEVAHARGTGVAGGSNSAGSDAVVIRELDLTEVAAGSAETAQTPGLLLGTWDGQTVPIVLARLG